jgi:hypothetical protein
MRNTNWITHTPVVQLQDGWMLAITHQHSPSHSSNQYRAGLPEGKSGIGSAHCSLFGTPLDQHLWIRNNA